MILKRNAPAALRQPDTTPAPTTSTVTGVELGKQVANWTFKHHFSGRSYRTHRNYRAEWRDQAPDLKGCTPISRPCSQKANTAHATVPPRMAMSVPCALPAA